MTKTFHAASLAVLLTLSLIILTSTAPAQGTDSGYGYYRYPALHGNTIVFTAEGDLWEIGLEGGTARRLTTHPNREINPTISPDGRWLAFSARYEGPMEVYLMPLEGGLPRRLTYEWERSQAVGWTPQGELLYSSSHYSTLPGYQLMKLDIDGAALERLPLAQARFGTYDESGKTLFFVRLPFMGSYTKRYKGGAAQDIWRFGPGDDEAVLLTGDWPGTNNSPMWHESRIYFVSDRDGTMNIWSMNEQGSDFRQHTWHSGWDVKTPSLHSGKIVYQLGADLHLYDITADRDRKIDIVLASDFDQLREKWVDKPMDYLTSAHISPDGDRVALTARGQVFVAPTEKGRLVSATRDQSVRYRNARFMPDGKSVLAITDETGELEFCTIPPNGVGDVDIITTGATGHRNEGIPSPDGKWIAYHDKDNHLWLCEVESDRHTLIQTSKYWEYNDLAWSPDSKWLAFSTNADNTFMQLQVYNVDSRAITELTSDRNDCYSPAWSPDGKWLYFLSDRTFGTIYGNVWGVRQEEPFIDKTTKIYGVALEEITRSPFLAEDEVSRAAKDAEDENETEDKSDGEEAEDDGVKVVINTEGLTARVFEVPISAGNFSNLSMNDECLFWVERSSAAERDRKLMALEIARKDVKAKELMSGIRSYELSADGKKLLVRQGSTLYVIDASDSAPSDLSKSKVDLDGWTFSLDPKQEYRQMFIEGWRLERDWFYDPGTHGVRWTEVLDKYLPLVDRITDRSELSDLLGQMVGELSALHTYIYGGDFREGEDDISHSSLGARLVRDDRAGGYRIDHIYQYDPDYPEELSPLARVDLEIENGDIIRAVNGVNLLDVADPGELLRNQAGKQVLLSLEDGETGDIRDVIIEPLSGGGARALRYNEWEYTRRLQVEEEGNGDIGYVHLRATSTGDFAQWARDFYPVFDRSGLIIDVRHNNGGQIDSWIIGRLMRKAWAYWQGRAGRPWPNMQYAFRGHIVVLCNEWTVSDGELFTEGIKRLGLGTVIGTRTLGGEIWLSSSNYLVDRGIATAAESGVFAPEGKWIIEGHGVDPDILVDNLPHATFNGRDAQLEAAIKFLNEKIKEEPVEPVTAPEYPDKSFR